MAQHLTLRARRLQGTAVLFCTLAAGPLLPAIAADRLADPTRPPDSADLSPQAARPGSEGEPQVQSILVSSRRREAIVNGQLVKVGDRVGQARVVAIRNTEVVLADASGARRSLHVLAELGGKSNQVRGGSGRQP